MATRIKEKYLAEAVPALQQKFGYKNVMEIPKLDKIVINMGLGDCKDNAKAFEMAINELTTIAGQKPMVTKAKKSIANFMLREGQNIGAKVTLRGARMEEFMDKLVNIALPRVRDFRGVSDKAFDGRGNYALGIREQLLFPEIEYDKVEKIRGMEMVFVTTAKTDEEAKEMNVSVPLLQDATLDTAKSTLEQLGLTYEVVGSGSSVISQSPTTGTSVVKGGKVLLYTEQNATPDLVSVPNLVGMTASQANETMAYYGLNYALVGASASSEGALVKSQSVPEGTQIQRGSSVTLTLSAGEATD